jgi:hypothetical protein
VTGRIVRVFALLAALWPAAAGAQGAAPIRLDPSFAVDGPLATLRLVPAAPIEARIEASGREAVLRFAAPIAAFDGSLVARELPRHVEAANFGFDSLLLVATPGTTLAVRAEGGGFVATFRLGEPVAPSPDADPADAIATERAERRLERLRAALDAQTGAPDAARRRLAALEAKDPADPETLAQFAFLELQVGRLRRAAELVARARAADPDNPELATAHAEIARERAGFVRADPEYRSASSGERRYVLGTVAELPVGEALRATLAFDQARVDSPGVRRPGGQSGRFDGTRQRTALGLMHESAEGLRTHGQIFANARRAGAGLSGELAGDLARLSGGLEIGRPYWDFTESLVADGTRDRAFAQVARPRVFGLDLRGRIGANRYGMPGLRTGARSVTLDADARLPLDGFARGAALVYSFDGEYPLYVAERPDPLVPGSDFRPVPLRYREVHALLAAYSLDFRRDLDFGVPLLAEFTAGPGYDRYGHRGGPLLGASLSWFDSGSVSGGLRWNYGRGVGRDANEFRSFGGFLRWRM